MDAAELLAARHAAHVLAMHQAMARIRQALMRPDLASVLLRDALAALEAAAVPVREPQPGIREHPDQARVRKRARERAKYARLKAAAES